jgi:uncharacterized YigZ family protein
MTEAKDHYYTIARESRAHYREKASRFLGFALPVSSIDQAKSILSELRKRYHDANHQCYAYRIGHTDIIWRVSDDNEPSGSAGKSIYGQIISNNLTDVLIVVIRYFGGTKLGIPGLIKAYRTTARDTLACAEIVERYVEVQFQISFPYENMNKVMRFLRDHHARILRQSSETECMIHFSIRKSLGNTGIEKLRALTNICTIVNT